MFSGLLDLNPVLLFLEPVVLIPASFHLLGSLTLIAASHRRLCVTFLRPSSQLGLWIKQTSRSCLLLIHLLGSCVSNADSLCLIEYCLKYPQKEAKRNKATLKEFNNTWTLF